MTHIDKSQETSRTGAEYVEAWLTNIKEENAQGQSITYREHIEPRFTDKTVSGSMLWDLMTDKKPLKRSLLMEQGFVCCYCGRRILNDHNTLIEHLIPKGGNNGDKSKVYDYQNLMASCMGGTKHIIHLVAGDNETKESIAKIYGISPERIEELNIDEGNVSIIGKKYDFNTPLRIRDRVLIIKKTDENQQHCGPKKDDNLIDIHPLLPDCYDHFIYGSSGQVLPAGNRKNEAETVIVRLGLNSNSSLKDERKSAIDQARRVRDKIMSNTDRVNRLSLLRAQIASYSPQADYSPSGDYEDAEFFRKPFWFVELAVFLNKVNLSVELTS